MFEIIRAAGWPIWPLLLASIIAVALIIERSITLRRSKVVPAGLLESVVGDFRQGSVTPEMLGRLRAHSRSRASAGRRPEQSALVARGDEGIH